MPRPQYSPPPPPGLGAHLFPAGTGQGCGRGWGRMCGYTLVGAWGFGTDRGLGLRPAWPARRTEVRAPPSLASAQTLRGDCATGEAPGRVCQQSREGELCPFSQKQRWNPGNSSLPVPLLPLCLLPLSTFTAACSACPFSLGAPRTPAPLFFTLSTPIFLSV